MAGAWINLVLLAAAMLCGLNAAKAQQHFAEVETDAKLDTGGWAVLSTTITGKQLFGPSAWTRAGARLILTKEMNIFSLQAGLTGEYTFDREGDNYTELRPWAGVIMEVPVWKVLKLHQRARAEWRNLFYTDESTTGIRLRYRLGAEVPLKLLWHRLESWNIIATQEWFIFPEDHMQRRFSDSGRGTWLIGKRCKNGCSVAAGYRREVFTGKKGNGHSLMVKIDLNKI